MEQESSPDTMLGPHVDRGHGVIEAPYPLSLTEEDSCPDGLVPPHIGAHALWVQRHKCTDQRPILEPSTPTVCI